MKLRRPKITSAHVISLLALFVALSGTVYAASSISGKAIKRESIPANRLKADSLTGAQINEGLLGTVPSATKAGEAAKAAEATKAASATKANEAVNATNAKNATHASNADSAVDAVNATNANNASALGGVAAAQFQRSCQAGAIRGMVRVNENNGAFNKVNQFNCAGGDVSVTRKDTGQYEVNFVGLDNLLSAVVSDINHNVDVDVEGEGAGKFLVSTMVSQAADNQGHFVDNAQFTVLVF